jgi:putative redox protein
MRDYCNSRLDGRRSRAFVAAQIGVFMTEKVLEAFVRETKESAYATEMVVDRHVLKGDQPVADGGQNLGPNPHETLLAALGECTAMTVRWYALRNHIPLDDVDVTLTYRRGQLEGHSGLTDIFTKAVHLVGASLTAEQRAKLIDVAHKCQIQRLLEGTPAITTTERA